MLTKSFCKETQAGFYARKSPIFNQLRNFILFLAILYNALRTPIYAPVIPPSYPRLYPRCFGEVF